ncbi:MAG: hypothetical protein HYS18_07550 [Burkholderiales bacterium]|nr:hypothetical protein [Burkholderiales bacterium]
MKEEQQNISTSPDCAKCMHYYITHDAHFPYGCRALGIKSQRKPHLEVLAASNIPCLAFRPKQGEKN